MTRGVSGRLGTDGRADDRAQAAVQPGDSGLRHPPQRPRTLRFDGRRNPHPPQRLLRQRRRDLGRLDLGRRAPGLSAGLAARRAQQDLLEQPQSLRRRDWLRPHRAGRRRHGHGSRAGTPTSCDNRIYDNWRRGVMLFQVPDNIACDLGTPHQTCSPVQFPEQTNSHRNRFFDNIMGSRRGARGCPMESTSGGAIRHLTRTTAGTTTPASMGPRRASLRSPTRCPRTARTAWATDRCSSPSYGRPRGAELHMDRDAPARHRGGEAAGSNVAERSPLVWAPWGIGPSLGCCLLPPGHRLRRRERLERPRFSSALGSSDLRPPSARRTAPTGNDASVEAGDRVDRGVRGGAPTGTQDGPCPRTRPTTCSRGCASRSTRAPSSCTRSTREQRRSSRSSRSARCR